MLAQEVNSSIYQILLCVRHWGYREKDSLKLHRGQSSREITHNSDSQSGKKKSKAREEEAASGHRVDRDRVQTAFQVET